MAALSGVSADTIRHYEKLGLIPKPVRTEGGYRLYHPIESPACVQVIRSALEAGFSLKELAAIFKGRDGGGAPCKRVAKLAALKVEVLEEQIIELTRLRDWLRTVLGEWRRTLAQTPAGRPSGLLESLVTLENPTEVNLSKGQINENRLFSSLRNGGSSNIGRCRFAGASAASKRC